MTLPHGDRLEACLSAASTRRGALLATTTAYRLIDDAADGLPGVTVDVYDAWAVASLTTEAAFDHADELGRALLASGFRGVYVKRRPRADLRRERREELAPPLPAGNPAPVPLVVREAALRFRVTLGEGLSTGLFADQRDNRALVQNAAHGRRVLNLFAYTCGFTVAAAVGQASATVSVDLSRRSLDEGSENLSLNGVASARHHLVKADALDWLRRARRRGDRFDVVVLDPPSFGTRARGTFSVARDYERVAADALALLSPGGLLLAVTNHRKTTASRFRDTLRAAATAAGRRIAELGALPMPVDFPNRPEGQEPTKAALVRVE